MIVGKNLDTGKGTLTFSSTGRKITLTPEEYEDFEDKLRIWKIQAEFEFENKRK